MILLAAYFFEELDELNDSEDVAMSVILIMLIMGITAFLIFQIIIVVRKMWHAKQEENAKEEKERIEMTESLENKSQARHKRRPSIIDSTAALNAIPGAITTAAPAREDMLSLPRDVQLTRNPLYGSAKRKDEPTDLSVSGDSDIISDDSGSGSGSDESKGDAVFGNRQAPQRASGNPIIDDPQMSAARLPNVSQVSQVSVSVPMTQLEGERGSSSLAATPTNQSMVTSPFTGKAMGLGDIEKAYSRTHTPSDGEEEFNADDLQEFGGSTRTPKRR